MDSPSSSGPPSPKHGGDMFMLAMPLLASRLSSASFFQPLMELLLPFSVAVICAALAMAVVAWACPGGHAWGMQRLRNVKRTMDPFIPGPRGYPLLGSLLCLGSQAHRTLAAMASTFNRKTGLIALSLGTTRLIVASIPSTAKEILCNPSFSDRPLKHSARHLLFHRAIGFAPHGDYWRKLRRIAATHLFSPRSIAAHEPDRLSEINIAIDAIALAASTVPDSSSVRHGCSYSSSPQQEFSVLLRPFLQQASLNNVMCIVFGRRYDFLRGSGSAKASHLLCIVREAFELLGAFNLADHLPVLEALDAQNIRQRCEALVPRVNAFVSKIISEHRQELSAGDSFPSGDVPSDNRTDFVHVLLALQAQDKLQDADIIAILWEMIFRGTDSVAILLEWILAELVLNPSVQERVAEEIKGVVGDREVRESDMAKLPYLQATVHETLRRHPPGPLLSWARLAIHDTQVGGYHIPAGTTAMVNMWAISHDPSIWAEPQAFSPDRFVAHPVDIRGSDLTLAPFGAGRRVCPGRALGLTTVYLWLARLIQRFRFEAAPEAPVDLSECLKLSCEMVHPLRVVPVERSGFRFGSRRS